MESSLKTIKSCQCCFFCNKTLPAEDCDNKKIKYEYIKHNNRKTSFFCPECASKLKEDAKATVREFNPVF